MNKQYKVDWDWTLNYSSHPTPPLPKIRTLESAGIIIDFIYQYTDVIFLDHLAVIMYPSPISNLQLLWKSFWEMVYIRMKIG